MCLNDKFFHKYHSIYGDWKYYTRTHSHNTHIRWLNLPFIYLLCKLIHLIRLYTYVIFSWWFSFRPPLLLPLHKFSSFFCVRYFRRIFYILCKCFIFPNRFVLVFLSFVFFCICKQFSALQIVFCWKKLGTNEHV